MADGVIIPRVIALAPTCGPGCDGCPVCYREVAEALRELHAAALRLAARDGAVIEHDPDEGCPGCPCWFQFAETNACVAAERPILPKHVVTSPAWCPLRSGPVTVRRPSTGEEGAC